MILHRTAQQKLDDLEPDKSDFNDILVSRYQNLSAKEHRDISLTETGNFGEEEAIRILKQYGKEHWIYFRNVWLDKNGRYESDLIVITNAAIYVFEIKNYDGTFVYDNGDCKINNYDLAENCIAQTNRAFRKMEQICRDASIRANIKGAIIFIGEFNIVEIKSPTPNIEVVTRARFKSYIHKMIVDETNDHSSHFPLDKLVQQLDKYSISDPFRHAPLTDFEFQNIKTGICCPRCQSYDVRFGRKYMRCQCGIEESRDKAVIRTICEYGVLRYDYNLIPIKLLEFLSGQISKPYLYKLLNMHFDQNDKGSTLTFLNKKLPFHKITDQFYFLEPSKLYLADHSLTLYTDSKRNPFSITI